MTALILVDIQNDFLPGGALAVPGGDAIVPVVNNLLKQDFDLVVATQDWHPQGHNSFAANHAGKRVGESIELNGLPQILWPVHCVQNTEGASFSKALHTSKIQKVFRKGTDEHIDSYSGFFDNGHKKSTGLGEFLSKEGIKDVCIVGLAADYCVKFSALDAAGFGFNTTLVRDATKAVNLQPDDLENALHEMEAKGVKIVNSAALFHAN